MQPLHLPSCQWSSRGWRAPPRPRQTTAQTAAAAAGGGQGGGGLVRGAGQREQVRIRSDAAALTLTAMRRLLSRRCSSSSWMPCFRSSSSARRQARKGERVGGTCVGGTGVLGSVRLAAVAAAAAEAARAWMEGQWAPRACKQRSERVQQA